MLSMKTGFNMSATYNMARSAELPEIAEQALGEMPIRLDFKSSPTLDSIENSLKCYEEVYGAYPEIIVVDNLTNVVGDSEDGGYAALDQLCDYLHDMARATEACVIVLHHVTGPFNDGNKPIPLSGIKGQVSRVPELILTLYKEGVGEDITLKVSAVKNRGGTADPTGQTSADLRFVGKTMTIEDYP